MKKKQLNQWLKALEIAKCLFEEQWYHTQYLEEIEHFIKEAAQMIQEMELQISAFNNLLKSLPPDKKTQTVIERLSIVYLRIPETDRPAIGGDPNVCKSKGSPYEYP